MNEPLRPASAASVEVFTASVMARGLAFARVLVTARLLTPGDFGRFVLVLAIVGGFEIATQPGLATAVVQARTVTAEQCNAVWTILVSRGLALSLLLVPTAGTLTTILGAPEAADLLRVAGLVFVLRSCTNLEVIRAVRRAEFRPQVISNLAGAVAETIISVVAVVVLDSAAGLVAGLVAGAAVEVAASHAVVRPSSRPSLDWRLARPLIGFSRWVFASGALQYVATTADDLLLARLSNSAVLARYSVAYRIASTPTTEVSHAFSRVALPVIARRQDEHDQLTESFSRYVAMVAGLSLPLAAVIATYAESITSVLLGAEWKDAATPMAILALAGGLRALATTSGVLFTGLGQPQASAALLLVRASVLVVAIVALVPRHGASGAAIASLASLVAMMAAYARALTAAPIPLQVVARAVAGRLPAVAVVGSASWAISVVTPAGPLQLVLGGTVSALVWLAAVWRLDRELFDLVNNQMRSVIGR